jgi:hypothetical protein
MLRRVEPELLDTLSPDDPRAVHSRRDLRRINGMMRNDDIMVNALKANFSGVPKEITELGAGDGDFLLRIARRMVPRWQHVKTTLLDLQKNVPRETLAEFSKLGWRPEVVVADVFDRSQIVGDIVIANLFLHHFENERLATLLALAAKQSELFVAVEPRRGAWPLFCSRMLWVIGCNDVTRHDAVVSVRAGFAGRELSALWPDRLNWELDERAAGTFSHLFVARRKVQNEI